LIETENGQKQKWYGWVICVTHYAGFPFGSASFTAAVPKLFGLRTPFAVKYFSRTLWRPVHYYRYL